MQRSGSSTSLINRAALESSGVRSAMLRTLCGPPPITNASALRAFNCATLVPAGNSLDSAPMRSEEHTSELQSLRHLVCRLLLEKKKTHATTLTTDRAY